MQKTRIISLVGLCIAILPFSVPLFSPWSRINCTSHEIDIVSGKVRESRYLYWIPISQNVAESELSTAAKLGGGPEWHHVLCFGPYDEHSPHYVFHSALYQIRVLKQIWDMYGIDEATRGETARTVLMLWTKTGNDHAVDDYLHELITKYEKTK